MTQLGSQATPGQIGVLAPAGCRELARKRRMREPRPWELCRPTEMLKSPRFPERTQGAALPDLPHAGRRQERLRQWLADHAPSSPIGREGTGWAGSNPSSNPPP